MDISTLRARKLQAADFHDFDWLLCADAQNLRDLRAIAPNGLEDKARLLLDWSGVAVGGEVPDPYYGNHHDFEQVWRLVDGAAQAVVRTLCAKQASPA